VTAAAFGQRRKMLRQSLRSLGVDTGEGFMDMASKIDGTRRAEEIDVSRAFVTLANAFASISAAATR
jgi:16S rRNA (adenine1518-N6/adenine1519-N6)-dimethyltransferase